MSTATIPQYANRTSSQPATGSRPTLPGVAVVDTFGVFSFFFMVVALSWVAFGFSTHLHNQSLVKTVALYLIVFPMLCFYPVPERAVRAGRRGMAWALGALLLYMAISAVVIAPSGARVDGLEELARWVSGLGLAVIAARIAFRDRGAGRLLMRIWVGIIALTALYGLVQVLLPGWDPVSWSKRERLFSTWANPTFAAGVFASALVWCFGELLVFASDDGVERSRRDLLRGSLLAIQAIVIGAALLLTFSRGGWLAGAAGALGLVAVSLLVGPLRRVLRESLRGALHLRLRALPLAAAVLAGGAVAAVATSPGVFQAGGRVQLGGAGSATTLSVRAYAWGAARDAFLDAPIVGHGLGMYQRLFPAYKDPDAWRSRIGDNTLHAHSEPAELAAETGLVGLALVLLCLLIWSVGIIRAMGSIEGSGTGDHLLLLAAAAMAGVAIVDGFWGVHLRWTSGSVAFWLPAGIAWGWAMSIRAASATASGSGGEAPSAPGPSEAVVRGGVPGAWALRSVAAMLLAGVILYGGARTLAASHHLGEGELLYQAGQTRRALASYQQALAENPYHLEIIYRVGALLLIEDEAEQALAAWRRLDELDAPLYASLARNEARALLDLQRVEEAADRWAEFEASERSTGSALTAYMIVRGAKSWDEVPAPLRLDQLTILTADLPALRNCRQLLGSFPPEAQWLYEGLLRDPTDAVSARLFASYLTSRGRHALAARVLEEVMVERRRRRGPWEGVLAESGPAETRKMFEEEANLRWSLAAALEQGLRSRGFGVSIGEQGAFSESSMIQRARREARRWWPLVDRN